MSSPRTSMSARCARRLAPVAMLSVLTPALGNASPPSDVAGIDRPPTATRTPGREPAEGIVVREAESPPTSSETRSGSILTSLPLDVRPESVGVRPAAFGPTTGNQVAVTNADVWHDAGFIGAGVRVGVIDFFDTRYWDETEHGRLPVSGTTARCLDNGTDCTSDFFDGVDDGGEDHGVAVVEAILDMAPGVEIYLAQASTLSDYEAIIEWFDDEGVSIVNRSLGSRFDGPGDGRGSLDDVAADAVARGMLWVNSGGNNASDRYYRHQARLVGGRVAFGPSGSDTFLEFKGCVTLGGVRWANDWDTPAAQRTDYDAYLWEAPAGDPAAGTVIASSTLRQQLGAAPMEHVPSTRCPRPGLTLFLELRWRGGDVTGDIIEVLDYGSGIAEYTQVEYSAAVSIVDAVSSGVVAVGAIEPVASGKIASYSSQGPTNDGRVAPALTAPSGYSSVAKGWFAGTSASAAVVTGAAALLDGASLAANPTALGSLLRHLTIDRGEAGPDNVFGHGELRLPDPPDAGDVDDRASRFVALDVPARILDTRPDTATGPGELAGVVRAGDILDLPVTGVAGVPGANVTAVAVNLVSIRPDRPSYLQAMPTFGAEVAGYSNLNTDGADQTRANFAVIPLGRDGSISIYSIAEGHIVADLLGWFEATDGSATDGRFVELTSPERLLDTRTDAPRRPLDSGGTLDVPLPAAVDPELVHALVVTVTAAGATGDGWVQAYPTDRPDAVAATSTVNTTEGGSVANTAVVPIGESGISLTGVFAGDGSSHVVVDAIGYMTSGLTAEATTGLFRPVRPGRALDSRTSGGILADGDVRVVDASHAPGIDVPDSASAVMLNLIVAGSTRAGFARTWAADRSEPSTSSLNWSTSGENRAAAVIAAVDDGRVRVRLDDGSANAPGPVAHLIADVFGYFT